MKLYVYRDSQCRGLQDAWVDGAVRYLGSYDKDQPAEEVALLESKKNALIVAEMIDSQERLVFIEVSEPDSID
jgi:hypothetical protein